MARMGMKLHNFILFTFMVMSSSLLISLRIFLLILIFEIVSLIFSKTKNNPLSKETQLNRPKMIDSDEETLLYKNILNLTQ